MNMKLSLIFVKVNVIVMIAIHYSFNQSPWNNFKQYVYKTVYVYCLTYPYNMRMYHFLAH